MKGSRWQPVITAVVVTSAFLPPYLVPQQARPANLSAAKTEQQFAPPVVAETKAGCRAIKDIVYAPDRGLAGDLYVPNVDDGGLHPAVIVIHGGAWTKGQRNSIDQIDIAHRLTEHGYAAFLIDYRLIQDGGLYPSPIKDVNDAFGYLVTNAAKWGVDPNRIGMFGGSVGGTMALLSAYAPHTGPFAPSTYKDVTQKVRAVVANSPLTDIRDIELTWVIKWMNDTPWHTPKIYADASPVTYVTSAVPTLLIHGTADSTVDFNQSVTLAKALRANGVTAELVQLPGANHHPLYNDLVADRERAFARMFQFLDKNLKGDSAP